MSGSSKRITDDDVLAVFDGVNDLSEPLATSEIAERLGCAHRTAYDKLAELAEGGDIESKQIGARARVWWRPISLADQSYAEHLPDTQSPPSFLTLQSMNRIERVLEVSPVSIVVVEPSGEISFANSRAEDMLGLERDEITSRTYRQPEWKITYDDGTIVPTEKHPVTRVLETGEPEYGFEHWIELPDGTERWLSSNSAPVLNEDGDVEYVIVGFEDATPLKERENKLTSDKRRLLYLSSDELFQPYLAAADGELHIEMDEVVTLSDGTALQYITATGISAKALSSVLEQYSVVRNARLLRSTDDHCRFEVRVEAATLPLVFDDFGGRVNALVRTQTDETPVLIGELRGDVNPRTVIQEARNLYSDIELISQQLRYTPRLLYDVVSESLTEKQFAALQTAYYGGYFNTPRTSTGDELAAQMGVTRQAFHQHLRKAEQTVYEQLFEASGKGSP